VLSVVMLDPRYWDEFALKSGIPEAVQIFDKGSRVLSAMAEIAGDGLRASGLRHVNRSFDHGWRATRRESWPGSGSFPKSGLMMVVGVGAISYERAKSSREERKRLAAWCGLPHLPRPQRETDSGRLPGTVRNTYGRMQLQRPGARRRLGVGERRRILVRRLVGSFESRPAAGTLRSDTRRPWIGYRHTTTAEPPARRYPCPRRRLPDKAARTGMWRRPRGCRMKATGEPKDLAMNVQQHGGMRILHRRLNSQRDAH